MNRRKLFIIISCSILLVVVLRFTIFKPRNQGLYKVTILPSLGGNFTLLRAINDKGQIAGLSKDSNGNNHLFIWDKENGIRDLGPTNGCISLNNSGQIASIFLDPNGNQRSFLWDPNTGKTILPTLGGKISFAFDINNHGQITGFSNTSSGVQHAFVWDNINGICDLASTSTVNAIASSINDSGQVIVSQNSNILVNVKGNKIVSSLAIPLEQNHINNNGFIVGMLRNKQGIFDVAMWHPTSKQTNIIKTNTGFSSFRYNTSYSYNINDLNQVIITEALQYKYLFKRNKSYFKTKNYLQDPQLGLISLDNYIQLKKDEELGLNGINNNGWIIGNFSSGKGSNFKGVLFEPIPEKMEQKLKKSKKHK